MTNQHTFVSSDRFDRDLYTSSKTAERVLNAAFVRVSTQNVSRLQYHQESRFLE